MFKVKNKFLLIIICTFIITILADITKEIEIEIGKLESSALKIFEVGCGGDRKITKEEISAINNNCNKDLLESPVYRNMKNEESKCIELSKDIKACNVVSHEPSKKCYENIYNKNNKDILDYYIKKGLNSTKYVIDNFTKCVEGELEKWKSGI